VVGVVEVMIGHHTPVPPRASDNGPMSSPEPGRPTLARTLLVVLVASTLSALPVLLLGGLAVLVRDELHFGELALGAAIGSFFAISGLVSLPVGWVSERIGPQRTMLAGLVLSVATMAGIAGLASSWATLVAWLIGAGAANALIQVAANHLLAIGVVSERQGVAFGIKQSAIPLAATIAGVSVPTVGLTLGWRAAYALAALMGLVAIGALWPRQAAAVRHTPATPRRGDAPILALIVLAIGSGLGTTAANALAGFSVSSSVDAGIPQDLAGFLLMAGSAGGIGSRIGGGWLADRLGRGSLLLVAGLLLAGTVGYAGLAAHDAAPLLMVMATLVAFAGGWGFSGLVLLAVTRTNPSAPAAALAIVRIGPNAGAVVGPLLFGALVQGSGYSLAWLVAASASLAAAALVLAGRAMLLPTRRRLTAG
jgi:MFS family permease